MNNLLEVARKTKKASVSLIKISEKKINECLNKIADVLVSEKNFLIEENAKDIKLARSLGKTEAFIDRLNLTDKVIEAIAEGLRQVSQLKSPAFKSVYKHVNKEQGISIVKKKVPFGTIGIIYESRPNVTADAFALCFKTRNGVILKGGSDSLKSNVAIIKLIKKGLKSCNINQDVVNIIEDTSRETTTEFMKLNDFVDLLIPRGSAGLIQHALKNATVPIIETGAGNCHMYIDKYADLDMATELVFNAKTQRYSVCNALESLVIHKDVLGLALEKIYAKLQEKDVEMRLDKKAYEVFGEHKNVTIATKEDFFEEYGRAVISVKTVSSLKGAIEHINKHSTKHSESIVTKSVKNANRFMAEIDSSSVYVNTSTRMTDGFVFGLGAEIGISTQKLHARGPMGLDALLTTKYFVTSKGAIRK